MKSRKRIAVFVALSLLGITGKSALHVAAAPTPPSNPVTRENGRTGTAQWRTDHLQSEIDKGPPSEEGPIAPGAAPSVTARGIPTPDVDNLGLAPVKGWAEAQSVNRGQSIILHISSQAPLFDLAIYRMGWYGGAGAVLVDSDVGLPGTDRGLPVADPTTGLIDTKWASEYTINTRTDWTSGFYLVQLTPTAGGISGYIPFVVRNDASTSPIVYQVPFNTYQAYNGWGGKSLYNFNSVGGPAQKVSYNRPYLNEDGAGGFFDGDYTAIRFLEREGYDITYVASSDVATTPSLMNNHKAFISFFHDEYWSGPMRANLESWIAAGKNVAFFSANNVYWQVRDEADSNGRLGRTMVAYKNAAADPVTATQPALSTVRFRETPLNRPENGLLGSMYEGDFQFGLSVPWTVTNASHFIYANTGLTNGAQIAGLVGYEWDRVFNNGFSPAGLTVLSDSPITVPGVVAGAKQQATIYQAPSGAYVFNASTVYWPRLLDAAVGPLDAQVQQMTRNILNTFGGTTPPPPPPTTTTTAPGTTTTVAGTTTTVAGTTTTAPATTTTTTAPPGGPSASQSSTEFSGSARRAIDGNTDGVFSRNSVTHTAYESRPWWQLDLGSVQAIGSLVLYNRTDCCSNRLSNFNVYVSSSPIGTNPDTQAGVRAFAYPGTVGATVTIPTNTTGRYVRIQLNGTNYLSLAEVKVGGPVAVTCPAGQWRAEYFTNKTLAGNPTLVRCEAAINNNWGAGSPDESIPADNFSVRWTTTQSFNLFTNYTYTSVSDDGFRLSLDGRLIINNWTDHSSTTNTARVGFTSGSHKIVAEYYEAGGAAVAKLTRNPA